jgi:Co/Zn/Cd efflux system component
MADTLRSIAVLLAAGIAFVFKSIDPSIADASASIVVSIIIALSLGPLLVGLSKTWKQISELRTERSIEIKESRKEMDAQIVIIEQFENLPHGVNTSNQLQ